MKCYLFGNVVVTDAARFAEYLDKVPKVIAKHGGHYIVRGGQARPVEGDLGISRMIMIEFSSREAAENFYDSADYAPLKQLRLETSHSQIMFVDALGPDYIPASDGDINKAVHKSSVAADR